MMIELFIFRPDALDAIERLQRRGFVTRLEYVSEPGTWETWTCGWRVSWKQAGQV